MFEDLHRGDAGLRRRCRRGHPGASDFHCGEYFIELEPRTLFSSVGVAEFRLNSTTTDQQQAVTAGGIAHSASGGGVAVWQSYNQDALLTWGVYGQRFGSDGSAVGSEFLINTASLLNDQQRPTVAMNDDGDFVVAWDGSGLLGLFPGIYVQRYGADGSTIGGAIGVAGSLVLDVRNASIGMDSSGGFVITYEANDVGLSRGIFARRYDSAGAPLGAAFVVNATTAGSQTDPQIVVAADGSFIVAWEGSGTGDGSGAFGRLYAADGTAITGEVRLNQVTAGNQSGVSLALTPSGFIAAWAGSGTEDGSGVYVRRFDSAGIALAGQALVNVTTAGSQGAPSVAVDPDGDFVVAWSGAGASDGAGIYFREFAADGTVRSGETIVNTTTAGTQGRPSISSGTDNGYAIHWGGNGTGDGAGVFAALLVNNPSVVTTSGGSASFIENGAGTTIDGGLTIADSDDTLLVGATVHIANFVSGQDLLLFTDQGGIAGNWDSVTGTLTLTGSVTVAVYQTALRSVSYRNTSDNPDITTRSVQFNVSDGVDWSTIAARNVTVTTVNDAPSLTNTGGSASFTENGSPVAVDPGLVVTDVDNTTLAGATVIVTNFVAGQDQLLFTDQGGIMGSWNSVSGVLTLTGVATVAAYQAALRSVTYRNTSDDPDTTTRSVQFTVGDGTDWSSAFSRGVAVAAINDAPGVTASGGTASFIENGVPITVDSGLVLADIDDTTLAGAVVTITNFVAGEDQLLFTDQGGITGTWDSVNGTLTLSGTTSVAVYQTALRSITYRNLSDNPDIATRTVQFQVSDGAAWSAASSRGVTVTAINDAPNVATIGGTAAFIENGSATVVDPGLLLTDPDSLSFVEAIVTISNYVAGEDQLLFTDQSGISGSWDALAGTLTLTGTASLAAYQAALRSVSYSNTSDNPDTTTRTVQFVVDDGVDLSTAATRSVSVTAVNDPPTVVTSGGAAGFVENGPPVIVDLGLVLADPDNSTLAGAVVTITNYIVGQDELLFTNQGGISGIWDAGAGTLTLSGTAVIGVYQTALRSVTYRNTSEAPDPATRSVQFSVTDGAAASAPSIRSVTVGGLNDAPVVTASPGSAVFVEDGAAVVLDPLFTIVDVDNSVLVGAIIDITNFVAAEDQLLFTDQGGITGSWDPVTGSLTLTGTASVAAYQTALRSVTYRNTSENPTIAARSIEVSVSDGVDVSAATSRSMIVTTTNDAPVVITSIGSAVFVEGGAPVAVDIGLLISDADDPVLDGAGVTITNFVSGQDELLFTAQAGITGSWDGVTGTLTLAGVATSGEYQAALRSVTFRNISSNPDTTPRSAQFTVADSGGGTGSSSRSVTVTAINDAPVVTTSSGTAAFIENGSSVAVDSGLLIADVDGSALNGAAVSIGNFHAGEDQLFFVDQAGITGAWNSLSGVLTLSGAASLLAYQTALRSVTYRNSSDAPDLATRTIEFSVVDGTDWSSTSSRGVAISATNDAPTVVSSVGTASFIENGVPVVVDPAIAVADADDSALSGAVISIINFIAGQDELLFTDQGGIVGNWDTTTGILTLSGAASITDYQTALRSITYRNTSDAFDTTLRVIQFVVQDAAVISTPSSRSMAMVAVNDAPTVTTSAGFAVFTENGQAVIVDAGLLLSDIDSSVLTGAVITVDGFVPAEDELQFDDQGGITGVWDPITGTLTVTGTATLASYQTALRSIAYFNNSESSDATARAIQFTVTDGADTSSTVARSVVVSAVNDVPLIVPSPGTGSFIENGAPSTVDSGLVLADLDSVTLVGATITISNFMSAEDRLVFNDQAGISGDWNGSTGTLTLSGSASISAYEAALRSVAYRNTSDNPNTASRVVQFEIDDGSDWSSALRSVSITAINDAPTVSASAGAATFIENSTPMLVDPSLLLDDADGAILSGALISLVNFVPAEDQLLFADQSGIVGTWDAATGVLTLSGAVTLGTYQAALRSITYRNTSEDPDTALRSVQWTVTDGADSSTPATRAINIIAVPETPVVITSTPPAQFIDTQPPPVVVPAIAPADIPAPPFPEDPAPAESRPDDSSPTSAPGVPKSVESPTPAEPPAEPPNPLATTTAASPLAMSFDPMQSQSPAASASTPQAPSEHPRPMVNTKAVGPPTETDPSPPTRIQTTSASGTTVILVPCEVPSGAIPAAGSRRPWSTEAVTPRAVTIGIVVSGSIAGVYGVWIILGLVSARSAYAAVHDIHEFDVVAILKQWEREQTRRRTIAGLRRLIHLLRPRPIRG
ncbi:MAG: hypothetical protein ACREJO_03110 [Phycisphaerales bacterium]